MVQGSASIEINRDPADVFSAIADVTRMGEWSPECVEARWVGGATGPAVGAQFEGDNRPSSRTSAKRLEFSRRVTSIPESRDRMLIVGG